MRTALDSDDPSFDLWQLEGGFVAGDNNVTVQNHLSPATVRTAIDGSNDGLHDGAARDGSEAVVIIRNSLGLVHFTLLSSLSPPIKATSVSEFTRKSNRILAQQGQHQLRMRGPRQ